MEKLSQYDKYFFANTTNSMKLNTYMVKKTRASRLGLELYFEHREGLTDFIVKFSRYVPPLLLLHREQPLGKGAEILFPPGDLVNEGLKLQVPPF